VVVFLQGESGMGKSYLLRRFMRRIRRDDPSLALLAGRCVEAGSVPYQAVDSLMEGLAGYLDQLPPPKAAILFPRDLQFLARLFPVLLQLDAIAQGSRGASLTPDPQELRRRAFGALRELLMRLGARYPLVLVIEDLQWGDLDTTVLLSNLLRGPDPPSMLAVFSCRVVDPGQAPGLFALQERLAEEGAEVVEIPVGPLDKAESQALAVTLLGGRPDRVAEGAWVVEQSGGSPYIIGELCRLLRSGGPLPTAPEERTLEAAMLARVAALPAESRVALEILALAGHPVRWEVLWAACGAPETGLELLTPLRAGHLIRAWGRGELLLEPYHDRIRQSVLSGVPGPRARELQLALAEAMKREDEPDAQALSLHLEAAGLLDEAGSYARAAADQALAALAFGRAAELLERVLRLTQPRGGERIDLLVKLGDALASAGLGSQAARFYLEAQPIASRQLSLRMQRRASEEFFRSGHFDQGEAVLREVMASIGMRLAKPSWSSRLAELGCRLRLRLRGYGFRERSESGIPQADLDRIDICWAAAMGLGPVDHIRGGEFQARNLLLALNAGEPFRVVRALAMEAIFVSQWGNRSAKAAQRLQSITSSLAERIGHPNPVSRALVAAGTSALMQGRWKPAVVLLDRAASLIKENCTALDYELHLAQFHALQARLGMGDLRDTEVRLSTRLQAAEDKGDLLAVTNLRTGISPAIHLAHDEPGRALRELQQAIGEWSSAGFHLQHYHALVSMVEILLYDGLPDLAMDELAGHWRQLKRSMMMQMQNVRITILELRARTTLALVLKDGSGRRNRERLAAAARDIRRLDAEGVGHAEALALRLQALEALALERIDEAGTLLYQAEQAFLACDMVLHAMVTRHRRGRLEGPSGAEQVEAAEAWMRSQRIANLPRFVAMHLPG
jgi:tetratricopeptide (TPR) repeat protein